MSRKLSHDQFLVKAKEVHGERYDYSESVYVGRDKPITYRCPDHGDVIQTAGNHLAGKGCRKCGNLAIGNALRKSREKFIADALTVHGDRFDYRRVAYRNGNVKVEIVCKDHGIFTQTPESHLAGAVGCTECKGLAVSLGQRFSHAEFLSRARGVHGDRFCYAAVDFVNTKTAVEIKCPEHGSFLQTPDSHFAGSGCSSCGRGRISEASLAFTSELERLGLNVISEAHPFENKRLSVDALIPDLGLAVEYHGLFWHSTGSPSIGSDRMARNKHLDRRKLCEAHGLRYVAIYEDEWLNERGKVLEYFKALAGLQPAIYARHTKVVDLTVDQARAFYTKNHFLGAPVALYNTKALVDGIGNVLGAMTITRSSEVRGVMDPPMWSLSRMAFDGARVVGGASKLFKACRLACPEAEIVSYVDLDKFTGGVYKELGFELVHEVAPDYWTLWRELGWTGYRRRHKTATKKSNLAKLAGYDPRLTEFENCDALGLHRIYHSGRLKMRFSPKPLGFVGSDSALVVELERY